ncbi:MAG: sigma 54-interacting transcriptional regulator [Desulfobacula sp.]|nr:sigma 54-interacting transcriptional regulator [Desulfobacula sp.]
MKVNIRDVKEFVKGFKGKPLVNVTIALMQITVIILVGFYFFLSTQKANDAAFNLNQHVRSAKIAGKIEQYFENLSGSLNTLCKIPFIREFDEQKTREMLALEFKDLKPHGINDIAVMDSKGTIRYAVNAKEVEGRNFSWRQYYKDVKTMGRSSHYILQFVEFKGSDTGKKRLLIAAPIFTQKKSDNFYNPEKDFNGLIIYTLELETLVHKFIIPQESAETGHIFLIDKSYTSLFSCDKRLFGKNLFKEADGFPKFQNVLEKMVNGGSGPGSYTFFNFDENIKKFGTKIENKLIAYAPINLQNTFWSIGIWAPKKDAVTNAGKAYVTTLMLILLVVFIILLGPAYSLRAYYYHSRNLEEKVDLKTIEFKQSHQRLLTILNNLDSAVYVADMESYELLFLNKHLSDLVGDVKGKICWQVLHDNQTGPCDFCTNTDLINPDGKPSGVKIWELKNKINEKWYEVRDQAISWVDNSIVRLEIATDISDRKTAEENLLRANKEMKKFCYVLKQISGQKSLDGVASFLINELGSMINNECMRIFIFNSDYTKLYILSEKGATLEKNKKTTRTVLKTIKQLKGLTISHTKKIFSPLVPDNFPYQEKQTIIPMLEGHELDGAFVMMCPVTCQCDEIALNMISLILEQASGTIKRAVLHEEELAGLHSRLISSKGFHGMIGIDSKMQSIYKLINDIAPTDATVLIQGESGTGKEMVACAIHKQSLRKDNPFVVINCAAYPETLLESELFGHEKGSFTGASRLKMGRFEQADGGTVFLDEISEISPSAQIKLLRVLQTRQFERLGGEKTLSVEIRILAATNKNLVEEVKAGNFREDLFYRLNVIPVKLPPLRDRPKDISLLARYFQNKFASILGEKPKEFNSTAIRILLDYHWPGNVRELENSIEHAVVLAKGNRIKASNLPADICTKDALSKNESQGAIADNEIVILKQILEDCSWNKQRAAKRLGISRSTLYSKLKKYKITKTVRS